MMNSSNNSESPNKPSKYAKRPAWQWVVLYIVIGGIVYLLIYLLFFQGKTGGGY